MRKLLLYNIYSLIFVLLLGSCVTDSDDEPEVDGEELRVGQVLPAFSVTMNDGSLVSNVSLQGQCAVIVFFNTGCADCRRELPKVQKIYEEMGHEVRFVCISRAEEAASIEAYWEANALTLPYSAQIDKSVFNLFAQSTIPRVYVTDASAVVRYLFVEKVEEEELRNTIEKSLITYE